MIRCSFIFFLFIAVISAHAEDVTSSIADLPEYSTPDITVYLSFDPPESDAISTLYAREALDASAMAWVPISGTEPTRLDHPTFHAGDRGDRMQFRNMAQSGGNSERVTLNDFESIDDEYKVFMNCTMNGFALEQGVVNQHQIQGSRCGEYIYDYKIREYEAEDDDVVGIGFTSRIPLTDWSNYRYLEFFAWDDSPEGMTVNIISASASLKAPLKQFSTSGDETARWNEYVINLNAALGPPEKRKQITQFSFTTPCKALALHHSYTFRLDAVYLWKTRNIAETTIDRTPPAPVSRLEGKKAGNAVEWNWKPAQDKESGITGYAYSWTEDARVMPPHTVMTTEPKASIEFTQPARFAEFIFKVRAINGAGVGSDIASATMEFKPDTRSQEEILKEALQKAEELRKKREAEEKKAREK
ncbi:MAG: hypothetical protein GC154_00580 [bacterium]|nr:hypothetical protein [bacterium]